MNSTAHEFTPDITTDEMFWRAISRPPMEADSQVERFMLAVASCWIEPGDFVVDLGANHGQHARVLAAGLGESGAALLVEADPVLAAALDQGAAASSIDMTVVNAAVGESDTREVVFYRHPARDQEGSLFRRDESVEYEQVAVAQTTLDTLLSGRRSPRFVKVDVEGAEYGALRGARGMLRDSEPLIACETWIPTGRAPEVAPAYTMRELIEFLDSVGWSLYSLDGHRVDLADLDNPGFPLHYQCWLAKTGSSAEEFLSSVVPELAAAFAWGASTTPPYPFKLNDHPVRGSAAGSDPRQIARVTVPAAEGEHGQAHPVSTTAAHELEETIRRLRLKTDALEQTSFERERLVAWYATEVANHRRRAQMHAQEMDLLRERADDAERRFAAVTRSTSWRTTLPIRAARRPRTYLRKMLVGS